MDQLNDDEIIQICKNSQKFDEKCTNEFFEKRIKSKYPDYVEHKKNNETWRYSFFKIIPYISALKNEYNFEYIKGDPVKIYKEKLDVIWDNDDVEDFCNNIDNIDDDDILEFKKFMKSIFINGNDVNKLCVEYKKYKETQNQLIKKEQERAREETRLAEKIPKKSYYITEEEIEKRRKSVEKLRNQYFSKLLECCPQKNQDMVTLLNNLYEKELKNKTQDYESKWKEQLDKFINLHK